MIENGPVVADVEVEGLPDRFVAARVLGRLPVGSHVALVVTQSAIVTQSGLDFIGLETADGVTLLAVVPGWRFVDGGVEQVEILSGLQPGDRLLTEGKQKGGSDE